MIAMSLISASAALSDGRACEDPAIANTRACTDIQARAIAKSDAAWLACGGACVIRQAGQDADLLDQRGEVQRRLAGMRFLPGSGRTDCLSALAFVGADGLMTVYDAASLATRETHALSSLYAADLASDPGLMDTIITQGGLSCDGTRFFAPSLDGVGFAVLQLGSGAFGETAWDTAPHVVIVSPSGRFGLGVESDGASTYLLRDFKTGESFTTDAVFERDVPFFDIDEKHLLTRKGELAEAELTIYDLATGERVGQVPYPKDGGLRFRYVDGQLVSLPDVNGE